MDAKVTRAAPEDVNVLEPGCSVQPCVIAAVFVRGMSPQGRK